MKTKPLSRSLVRPLTRALSRQGGRYALTGANYFSSSYNATNVVNLSVAAWVNPSALVGQQAVVDQSTGTTGFCVRANGSDLEAFAYNNGGIVMLQTSDSAVFTAGVDTHVVATYETNQIKLYADGVLVASSRSGGSTLDVIRQDATNGAALGRQTETAGQFFTGDIGYVHLWRGRTLNAIEIENLYVDGRGPFAPTFYF